MILQLRYFGDPILRQVCKKVEKITKEICTLASDMIETMDALKGVGLAANQVGMLYKLFVIRPEVKTPEGEFALGPAEVYINPILSSPSQDNEVMAEGCLSFPGLHVEIFRPSSIHIEAIDLNGNPLSTEVFGFKAREIMHENDHLNGKFFIDRLSIEQKRSVEPALRKIREKYTSSK